MWGLAEILKPKLNYSLHIPERLAMSAGYSIELCGHWSLNNNGKILLGRNNF